MASGKNGWIEEGKRQGLGWAVGELRRMIREGKSINVATIVLDNEYKGRVRQGAFPEKTEKEMWQELQDEKLIVVGTMKAAALISAWECFHLTDEMLAEFLETYNRYVQNLDKETFSWVDIFETLESELGVTIDLKHELEVANRGSKRRNKP